MGKSPAGDPPAMQDPARIRRMFADIAPSYDFLNHFLSANRDRSWRRRAIGLAGIGPGDRVLDVCTGTGDLALEAALRVAAGGGGRVVGADFCPEMVRLARRKSGGGRSGIAGAPVRLAVADTLRLPFPDRSFDAVTVGFGIRNVADLDGGLAEMLRILRPGGRAAILEFTTPRRTWFRRGFELYFHHILPRLGRWLSSAPDASAGDAYSYLPDSVARFPDPRGLEEAMRRAGYDRVSHIALTLGVATVHLGFRPADGELPAAIRGPQPGGGLLG